MVRTLGRPLTREPGFLNVDLELGAKTRSQLAPLLDALDGTLFELLRGRIRSLYRAHYEIAGCGSDASGTISALVAVIEALPRDARCAWDAAAMRDFNVGVELAPGVRSVELAIAADATQQVATLGGRIVFTPYRVAAKPPIRARRAPRAR